MATTLVTGAMGCAMGVGLATDVLGAEGLGLGLAQECGGPMYGTCFREAEWKAERGGA